MKVLSTGPEQTQDIARRLGMGLKPGTTVCLFGELGSGKTVFAKGLAGAFGIAPREVTSASFTLAAEYESDPPFCHMDLYRLEPGSDLESIGLYEYMAKPWVTVVEWADRMPAKDTEDTVRVSIKFVNENTREIIIEGADEKDRDHL